MGRDYSRMDARSLSSSTRGWLCRHHSSYDPFGRPRGIRDAAIFSLGLVCGLRACEVVRLTTSDYSKLSGTALIHGKGNEVAYVPILGIAQERLEDWGSYFVATPASLNQDSTTPRSRGQQLAEYALILLDSSNARGGSAPGSGYVIQMDFDASRIGLTENTSKHIKVTTANSIIRKYIDTTISVGKRIGC